MHQRAIEYVYALSAEQSDRLRVRAQRVGPRIVAFAVQYEARLQGTWHPIVRFDATHGFAHRDLLHPDGRVDKTPLAWENYNIVLTWATQELKTQWRAYRRRYEDEIRGRTDRR